jgi:adenine-specific DNA-methyltransferase
MKNVFLSGSRRLSRLPPEVRHRLDEMIRRELTILVGDANGADKAIQTYFAAQHYANVLVFCTAGDCRNNVGRWPIHAVDAPHRVRDFAFFTAKDAAMADEADVGLALWDGQSSGTIVNVARLVTRAKPAVVYVATTKTFATLKTPDDLVGLLSSADTDVRTRVEEYIHDHVTEFAQPQMF